MVCLIELTPDIKKKMKKIAAMHAILAVLCFSITIFSITINNSKSTTGFSILTAANIAGIITIAFFYRRGYV